MLQIISRAIAGVNHPPNEPMQPVYQGQDQTCPSASTLLAPAADASGPEGPALMSVAEGFIRQLPCALSSWPEVERQIATDAQLGFTAEAMVCTAEVAMPAANPGLEGLSSQCRRAIFTAAGPEKLSAPAAALAGSLLAFAPVMRATIHGKQTAAKKQSGAGSQLPVTAAVGWVLSLHALYVVLPLAELPPLQPVVEDLASALATALNAASDRQVSESPPLA